MRAVEFALGSPNSGLEGTTVVTSCDGAISMNGAEIKLTGYGIPIPGRVNLAMDGTQKWRLDST